MRKIICVLFLLVGVSLSAQNIAVKTNLLYDASSTINLGTEIGLSPKWTLDLSANYNGWTFSDICWAGSTTGEASRCRSDSGRTWKTTATKVGMLAPVWSMVTSGCWVNVGALRLPLASAIYVLITTSTSALNAVNGKIAAKRTTWVSPRLPFL